MTATTLSLSATYDYWTERNTGEQKLTAASLTAKFATIEEGQAFADQFPKSTKLRVCTLSNDPEFTCYLIVNYSLEANGVNGARNETAEKRYHAVIARCAKLGIPVEYTTPYGNSYATREAFEAKLA